MTEEMAVTYKKYHDGCDVQVPVLHRVVYAHAVDGTPAKYQRSYKDYLVDEWLRENCQSQYYHSPLYLRERFIEFEDDVEATLFALRWA